MSGWPGAFPLPWHDPRTQELQKILATSATDRRAVAELMLMVGLDQGDVFLEQPVRLLWHDVLDYAASQQKVRPLLDAAATRYPAIQSRIDNLQSAKPRLSTPNPGAMTVGDLRWKNFDLQGRERQIVAGQNTLLDVAFLDRGRRCARSVCRIVGSSRSGPFYATGFRVGRRTILTNHHVLHDWDHAGEPADTIAVEFAYEVDEAGLLAPTTPLSCDTATIQGERDADWAVIESVDALPEDIPTLDLPERSTVTEGDRVSIIQHPLGLPKKIAMAHNLIRFADNEVVQYWTDTEAGSSGSPVFDEQWRLVALHHQWVDAPDEDGVAYRNQGRQITDVRARMLATGITDLGPGH